jgi:hypothetical protein
MVGCQALLALAVENTDDDEKREKLLDAILTIPPLTSGHQTAGKSFGILVNS